MSGTGGEQGQEEGRRREEEERRGLDRRREVDRRRKWPRSSFPRAQPEWRWFAQDWFTRFNTVIKI